MINWHNELFQFGHGDGLLLGKINDLPVRVSLNGATKNLFVFGSSGFDTKGTVIIPSLLQAIQAGESIIVTDETGKILRKTKELLQENGYMIKVLNPSNCSISDRWNPLTEIKSIDDVQSFAEAMVEPAPDKVEPYFDEAEKTLLKSLLTYMDLECPPEKQGLVHIYGLFGTTLEELDSKFNTLPQKHISHNLYNNFRRYNQKVRESLYLGLKFKMSQLNENNLEKVTQNNDIDLKLPGIKKCAYFYQHPGTINDYGFMGRLFITFLLRKLCATESPMPIKVNVLLDGIGQVGEIPDMDKYIARGQRKGINFIMSAYNLPELRGLYPREWQNILKCCAAMLFTGIDDHETAQYFGHLTGQKIPEGTNKGFFNAGWNTVEPGKIAAVVRGHYTAVELMNFKEHPLYRKS